MFLFSERRECSSETDNRGTTTLRTKIYIYTLSCQWDVVLVRKNMRRGDSERGFSFAFNFFPLQLQTTQRASSSLLCRRIYNNMYMYCMSTADDIPQNVLSALNFSNYNSTFPHSNTSVRATRSLWSVSCWIFSDGTRGSSVKRVCCRFGRTVWSIYMCSSTLIYLLFTKSIHTVHPQISMIQLVAPPQTVSEMFDGHRERWRGWTSRASVFFEEEATANGSQCWVYTLYKGHEK